MKHGFIHGITCIAVSIIITLLLLVAPVCAQDGATANNVDFTSSPIMSEAGNPLGFAGTAPLAPQWSARADELRRDQLVRQSMSGLVQNLREAFRDDEQKSPVGRLVRAFSGELQWDDVHGKFEFKPGKDPEALLAKELTGMTQDSLMGLASQLPTDSTGDRFISALAGGAAKSIEFEKPGALRFRTKPLMEGFTGGVSGLLSNAAEHAPMTSALAAWAGQIGWNEKGGKFALKPSGKKGVSPEQAATAAVQGKLQALAGSATGDNPFTNPLVSGLAGSVQVTGPFSMRFRTQPVMEGLTGGVSGLLSNAADEAPFASVLAAWTGQIGWDEKSGKFALKPSGKKKVSPEQAATAAVQAKLNALSPRIAPGDDVFSRALVATARDFTSGIRVTGPFSMKFANIAPQNDTGEKPSAYRLSTQDIAFRFVENFKTEGRQDLLTPLVDKFALFRDDKVDGLLRTYLANMHFNRDGMYATPYKFDMTKTLALGTPGATFALTGPVQGRGNTWDWSKVKGQFRSVMGQGNVTMDLLANFGVNGTHDAMYRAGQVGLNFRLGADSTFRAALALDAHQKRAGHTFTLSHKLGKTLTASTTYTRPYGSDEPNVAYQLNGKLGSGWDIAMAFSGKYHDQPNTQLTVKGKIHEGLNLALALKDQAGKPRQLNCGLTGQITDGLSINMTYADVKNRRNWVGQLNGAIAPRTNLTVSLTQQTGKPQMVRAGLTSELLDGLNLSVNYDDINNRTNLTGQITGSIAFN